MTKTKFKKTDTIEFIKHSLAELDDVLDEIIQRNPDWMTKLEKIIKANK